MARVVFVDVVYQRLGLRLTRAHGVRPEGAAATLMTVDARSLRRSDRLHSGTYCNDPCTCRHQPTVFSQARLRSAGKWRRAVRDKAQQPPDTHTHTLSLPSVLQLTAFDISATRAPTDAVEACSRTQASPCPACSNVKCLADVLLSWCLYRHVLARIFFCDPRHFSHFPLLYAVCHVIYS